MTLSVRKSIGNCASSSRNVATLSPDVAISNDAIIELRSTPSLCALSLF